MAAKTGVPNKLPKRKLRPGKAREQQAELLRDATSPSLDLDAPEGRYHIDGVFTKLKASGIRLREEIPDEVQWIRRVTTCVGAKTIDRARTEIVGIPSHYEKQKRQRELLLKLRESTVEAELAFASTFDAAATSARDLHRWITTKGRIQELGAIVGGPITEETGSYTVLSEEYRELMSARPPCHSDELQERVAALEALSPETIHEASGALAALRPTSKLQKCLAAAYGAIEEWLEINRLERIASDNSPNKKPVLKWFISFSTHAWHMMTGHFPAKSEYDIFARMLAAAWKDLGLDRYDAASRDRRTKEYRWFRDRLENAKSLIHDSY